MILNVISSGSSGNCYVLKSETGSLLIECGVRFDEIQKALGYDLLRILGTLGSHCHLDHMRSAKKVMDAGID
jgi:phosphoribosyl 1,2-cyclic phosphodiesterase